MMEWKNAPLKEVAPAEQPEFPKPHELVWDVSLDDIESETGRLLTEKKTLARELGSSKIAFDERNVLYMKLRPYLNKVLLPGKFGVGSSELIPLRPQPSLLDRRYLWYYLRSPQFVHFANKNTAGANLPRVSMRIFWEHEIPLPPLPVQRRIAAVLDKADALRRKRRRALDKLDDLLQAVFLDMFGDPVTNPKGWPRVSLSDLVRKDDKINYGVVQPGSEYPDGVPLIRVNDFAKGTVETTNLKTIDPKIEARYNRSRLKGDEVLISCVGSIGNVALADKSHSGYNIARAVARVPLGSRVEREYMAQYLRSGFVQHYFINETRTVSQPTLNISLIKNTPVFLPPLSLQRQYKDHCYKVARLKTKMTKKMRSLDDLFLSLVQKAFKGELDFPEEIAEDAERTRVEPAAQLSLFE